MSTVEAPREFAPRGPVELGDFLHAKREELARVQADLQQAHEVAERCEIAWIRHFDGVIEDVEEGGEKLPGEEKCVALARRRGGWELWTAWRRAERWVKRLEKTATLISEQIGAAQSEAKLLRAVES